MKSLEMGLGSPEQKTPEQKQQMVAKLSRLLHDKWRAPREKKDADGKGTGKYEPRVKVLVNIEGEEKWFNKGDSKIPVDAQVLKEQDIANTSYEELDPNWQKDNKVAAKIAMNEVFSAVEKGQTLDDPSFIESASAVIHDEWLKRNGGQATEIQKKPYEELLEDIKEQDRVQLKKAIEIYQTAK